VEAALTRAEHIVAAGRGRNLVSRGILSLQRARLVSWVVRRQTDTPSQDLTSGDEWLPVVAVRALRWMPRTTGGPPPRETPVKVNAALASVRKLLGRGEVKIVEGADHITLQEAAADAVGADRVPHLLSMEAWNGCYVPVPTGPVAFDIPGNSAPLKVGSVPALVGELEAVGAALGLPTDEAGLRELADEHADDEPEEGAMDFQTYAELLRAAHVARSRRQVLWVVK
jgi:hypothetical protein